MQAADGNARRRGPEVRSFVLVLALLAGGCGGGPPQAPTVGQRPATGGGRPPPAAPGQTAQLAVAVDPRVDEGRSRRIYRLHIAASYPPDRPIALLLDFHGAGGSAAGEEQGSGWDALADGQTMLVAYPEALHIDAGTRVWGSAEPLDYGVADLAYSLAVIDDVERVACVDVRRVYLSGFSNGAGMAELVACDAARRIAAIAPASGNYYIDDRPPGCHPARRLPVLEVHGTTDRVVPYDGIDRTISPEYPLLPIPQWLAGWAARDGCAAGPVTFLDTPEVTGLRWTGCGDGTAVEHYRWNGGGHGLPPAIGGVEPHLAIWRFLSTFALPAGEQGRGRAAQLCPCSCRAPSPACS